MLICALHYYSKSKDYRTETWIKQRNEHYDSLIERAEFEAEQYLSKKLEQADLQIQLFKEQERQKVEKILDQYAEETQEQIEAFRITTEFAESQSLEKLAILEDLRQKYDATIVALKRQQADEQQILYHMIEVSDADKADIKYLLTVVSQHLNHPDILNKLVWSEFIQKPMNELLDRILPKKDCSGIYKITNILNGKSYIGQATKVKDRLISHAKGALGINTIADQKVHRAMREEGVWSFKFELLEECDKEKLSEREKYYIKFFQTNTVGYNQTAGGAR